MFVRHLARARASHDLGLFAWVLMPEHFHLLLMPRLPESPVSEVLNVLKGESSEEVLARWRNERSPVLGSITTKEGRPRFWQAGGGYDRNVRREDELVDLVNYIHQNPVRRGLVKCATDWKWSSALWHSGVRDETMRMDDPVEFKVAEVARLERVFGTYSNAVRAVRAKFNGDGS